MGDATSDEICAKEKLYVSFLRSATLFAADIECLNSDCCIDVPQRRDCCPVQVVRAATAKHTMELMKAAIKSVGAKTWAERALAAVFSALTVFCFALDAGPDNVAGLTGVVEELEYTPWVSILSLWCLLHQYSLMMKYFYSVIDKWAFADDIEKTPYVTCVSSVAGLWRSPGTGRKLFNACADVLFDAQTAQMIFGKTPGRCIRTRWHSVGSIEQILRKSPTVISSTFNYVFPSTDTEPRPTQRSGPLADLDEQSREQRVNTRLVACRVTKNPFFMVKLIASDVAQKPTRHFFLWSQAFEKKVTAWNEKYPNKAYMGSTMMSELVCSKAFVIEAEFAQLLDDTAVSDEAFWAPVWMLLPPEQFPMIRDLILTLVFAGACQWHFRVMLRVLQFWPLLLVCCEELPTIRHPRRKEVAQRLLAECPKCLQKNPCSDVAIKIRHWYRGMWETAAMDGSCPVRLFGALRVLRSHIDSNTQKVEGANGVLQRITRAAPNIQVPLASDRLSLKLGAPLDTKTCLAYHENAMAERTVCIESIYLPTYL